MPLTRRQLATIPYLVSGASLQEVSRIAGVSDESLRKWLEQPEFADLLDSALEQSLSDAVTKAAGANLAALLPDTMTKLREILEDPKAKPRTKLLAIRTAWDIGLKLTALKAKVNKSI